METPTSKSPDRSNSWSEKPATLVPEFFRLPAKGRDTHFGLSRAWFYAAEADGRIQLIRLRSRGKKRGVTLVSYMAVRDLILAEQASATADLNLSINSSTDVEIKAREEVPLA